MSVAQSTCAFDGCIACNVDVNRGTAHVGVADAADICVPATASRASTFTPGDDGFVVNDEEPGTDDAGDELALDDVADEADAVPDAGELVGPDGTAVDATAGVSGPVC
ncbi:hypothetical protein [Propionibacterium cyclohexanicum]|uniref:hypothetical protein n=1 Tax=Propionibacterium cyclohexanicum TaxID=64702 RepID=UPI001C436731|nr:hypothetical protein [Propionibacterium cyclohexanicum]